MHDLEARAWYIGPHNWVVALTAAIQQAREDETVYLWSEGQRALGDNLLMRGQIRPGFHIALVVDRKKVEAFYDRHRQTS